MNKSQKNSLVALAIIIMILVFCMNEMLILKLSPFVLFVLTYFVMGLSAIFLRRKRNHSEVDYDERDTIIKQKAILVSYITLWILVLIGCTVPVVLYEHGIILEMAMLVNILPVSLFLIFVLIMLVYSLTVLIQYSWRNKDE